MSVGGIGRSLFVWLDWVEAHQVPFPLLVPLSPALPSGSLQQNTQSLEWARQLLLLLRAVGLELTSHSPQTADSRRMEAADINMRIILCK